ncbi:aspartyl/asparaginyl beta-hydroxylase domain-containing protein [Ichthyenterobacterium sp. W332]|uniref:Aspartyl/asparaginyl beta-hydroxylase domain-containing protein n=1 Tax=Microcosmobacter mediterraneus TaxID=3075607 RepID=A0ABU2YKM2_9FLAO|nr:aspartyl/asparaginyl beta-hydroxylase domain-containing protein [Ichthyenterobacterium sp. W332]MDT0558713.1 aspartyl/asparaginyl beta-hydroxylase domain-containing protein [Ichthyenterobacterium sp. W332]
MNFRAITINYIMKFGNLIIKQYDGGQNRPVFFDVKKTFPKLSVIEENFNSVKTEFENVNKHFEIPAYHEVDQRSYAISAKVEEKLKWKVFLLNYSGKTPDLAKELCPKTTELLNTIPNAYKVFFSVLEPGKSIPAHHGPYRGYLRYHLGLQVPKNSPPSIRIKDKIYHWKEKESILFDDTWDHEVINNSDKERAILIIDLLRPLPFIPNFINKFIAYFLLKKIRINKVLKNVANLNQNRKNSKEGK